MDLDWLEVPYQTLSHVFQATGYIFGDPEAATCTGAPREGEVLAGVSNHHGGRWGLGQLKVPLGF